MQNVRVGVVGLVGLVALGACRRVSDGGDFGVGQGGAQDFGLFRDILEQGGLPGPETIDDVGFFAEHKLDLPPADCGEDVCIHGRLGLMGNMINGSDCTVVMIGMNTPIDPTELTRPPLNLVLVVDTSGSMESGNAIDYVRTGLDKMLDVLQPDDHVSLITFSTDAQLVAEGGYGDTAGLASAIAGLRADGGTNIHEALRLGYATAALHETEVSEDRVLLLSDGLATEGNTSSADILDLAELGTINGHTLTTIGVGSAFDIELMRGLSEAGEGSFYYLEDPAAVEEVFVDEVDSFLVPLATDGLIEFTVAPRWRIGGVYGTLDAEVGDDVASITIDRMQLAGRMSADDDEPGRRGGGGAIVVELVPENGVTAGEIGRLDFSYLEASSGDTVTDEVRVSSPLDPEGLRDGLAYFDDASVEKSFVMLNLYVGFELAAQAAVNGEFDRGLATLRALCNSVTGWLEENPDADIADDLVYVELFIDNLERAGADARAADAADPWPRE